MKLSSLARLRCPTCGVGQLEATGVDASSIEIREGTLRCVGCADGFPIVRGVPRFVSDDNYARSFGFQWGIHARTQLDAATGNDSSRQRFFRATGWPENLRGQRILEAGSGAGRFTAIAVSTGASVDSFDYSAAVDANLENNGAHPNLELFQADIYRIPFARASYDKVVCLGVLQHCPDPARAFQNLVSYVAPGGEIVVDVYSMRLRSLAHPRFWMRPVTTRMPRERLYRAIRRAVPVLLPIKRWLLENVPLGRYPAYLIPVAYQEEWHTFASQIAPEALLELSTLDTFDWLSPVHDHPQTRGRVRRWFTDAGLGDISVEFGPNGIIAKGRTQPHAHA